MSQLQSFVNTTQGSIDFENGGALQYFNILQARPTVIWDKASKVGTTYASLTLGSYVVANQDRKSFDSIADLNDYLDDNSIIATRL